MSLTLIGKGSIALMLNVKGSLALMLHVKGSMSLTLNVKGAMPLMLNVKWSMSLMLNVKGSISFNQSLTQNLYSALQDTYSEALPTQAKRKRTIMRKCQKSMENPTKSKPSSFFMAESLLEALG